MDSTSGPPHELPRLYRTILDLVLELERCEGGAEARGIRTEALAAYGGPWNWRNRRRLEQLEGRLLRSIADRRGRPRRATRLP
jgi:hypothetical protein